MSKLDKKDLQIIQELDHNGRISYSSLAKKVQLSKEVVRYRVQRLIKENIIEKIIPIIDYSKLSMEMYHVLLNFHQFTVTQEKELATFAEESGLSQARFFLENWDFGFFFFGRKANLIKTYDNLMAKQGQLIVAKNFSLVKKIDLLDHNYLFNEEKRKFTSFSFENEQGSVAITELDRQLLSHLHADARINLAELAIKLKKPVSTVTYRFRWLQEKKILLGYRLLLNYSYFGMQRFVLRIWLNDNSQKNKVIYYLQQEEAVFQIVDLIGNADVEIEVHLPGTYALKEFLVKMKEVCTSIKEIEVIHLLKEIVKNPL